MATRIQLRGDTAANWTLANPVLAEREMGLETDTDLYKIGNGVTAWNSLSYKALRQIDDATIINMSDQAVPANPSANTLNFFAKSLSGRMALRVQGPSGIVTPLQPSFFQNNIIMINTNTTTSITSIGDSVTSVGTLSHPTVTEQYGRMTNFACAATSASTCGTGTANLDFLRGSVVGANGFFFNTRLGFPDSNYNETGASTGSRIFVGMTDQTMAASVGSNNPSGNRFGFQRLHVNGSTTDTNWFINSKDGTTENRIDTGCPFVAQKVYDFYFFCTPQGNEITWRIDNVTDNTSFEGSATVNLPTNTQIMRAGFQIQTVNATARNIRMQRVYIESDR